MQHAHDEKRSVLIAVDDLADAAALRNEDHVVLAEGNVDIEDFVGDVGKTSVAAAAVHRADDHRDAAVGEVDLHHDWPPSATVVIPKGSASASTDRSVRTKT